MGHITRRVLLTFSGVIAEKPVVSELIKKYDLEINIYRANITPNEEGHMAIEISGEESRIEEGLKFINSFNVDVNSYENSLVWDEDKCVSCGNCLTHCPTDALYIADTGSRKVVFNGEKCIECMSCVRNCPFGACSSIF